MFTDRKDAIITVLDLSKSLISAQFYIFDNDVAHQKATEVKIP